MTGLGRVWQWSWGIFGVHLRLSAVFLEKCQGFGKSLGLVRCGVLCFLFVYDIHFFKPAEIHLVLLGGFKGAGDPRESEFVG